MVKSEAVEEFPKNSNIPLTSRIFKAFQMDPQNLFMFLRHNNEFSFHSSS